MNVINDKFYKEPKGCAEFYIRYLNLKLLTLILNECIDLFGNIKYKEIKLYTSVINEGIQNRIKKSKGMKYLTKEQLVNVANLLSSENFSIIQVKVAVGEKFIKIVDDYSYTCNGENYCFGEINWKRDFNIKENIFGPSNVQQEIPKAELAKLKKIILKLSIFFQRIDIERLIENNCNYKSEVCICKIFPFYRARKSYDEAIFRKEIKEISFVNSLEFEKRVSLIEKKVIKNKKKYANYRNISKLYAFQDYEKKVTSFLPQDISEYTVHKLLQVKLYVIIGFDQIMADQMLVRQLEQRDIKIYSSVDRRRTHGFRT